MTAKGNTTTRNEQTAVRSIIPCLTFNDQAEEAVTFYVSVVRNSRIVSMVRSNSEGPVAKGKVLHAVFELNGREFTAFDGGPSFSFSQGVSLVATCETQDELDEIWQELSQGGEEGPCGWLKDKFGVSWQVFPEELIQLTSDSDPGRAQRATQAMLTMRRIDMAEIRRAADSVPV